jgi:hypothetical protein
MIFFFKKRKIYVDCFIANKHIAEIFPLCRTVEKLPQWWKSLPKSTAIQNFPVQIPNIKKCPGFKDLFMKSICIPSWSEYRLFQDPSFGFSHVSPNNQADGSQHQEDQLGGAFPKYQHYKLVSPWHIKEKTGIYFIMMQASWHTHTPCDYHMPGGCLEFKYQHSTHINLVAEKKEKLVEHTIQAGQPLVYLIPITERETVLNIHVVDDKEINKLKTYHHSFHNSYEITKKILKRKHE